MLDREILKTDYAVSYGSVTLSSLQNDSVPDMDLLVREAIQNSSDAAIGLVGKFYRVGFQTGTFAPAALNNIFDRHRRVFKRSISFINRGIY